jgi:hypothetical protein
MKIFGEILPKDHTVENFSSSATFRWKMVSSSLGTTVVEPTELDTALTILRGNADREKFIRDNRKLETIPISNENGIFEHVVYSSVKHLYYDNNFFISGSDTVTSSFAPLTEDIFVVSIGQDFYGERIKPGSFKLSVDSIPVIVEDDGIGNLFISGSGNPLYIGNIFYDAGIAVLEHDTSSSISEISNNGIKIIEGTNVFVEYDSETKIIRHQLNVKLKPQDFNISLFNPSINRNLIPDEELAAELIDKNILERSTGEWNIFSLMQSGIIKPYVTTIGLYTDKYELVAIAKLSTPIQRTFDSDQIFIVRFDT